MPMSGTDCPREHELLALHVGELPEEAAATLARHLETCAACEAVAQRLDSMPDQVIAALRHTPPVSTLTKDASLEKQQPALSADAPVSLPGYEILEEVGRGGMGVVYKARQRGLNRLVAVKMILAGSHATPEERRRFLVEAEMAARLRHPNMVSIYEVGEHEGRLFLALEYVDGGTLADTLRGPPRPAGEAAALIAQLAVAMQHAHQLGIIHRDLKPANILLQNDESRVPKITDFGLARPIQAAAHLTAAGLVVGTPAYMAPEQTQSSGQVGLAGDVYSLGAILYELLTGRPPFVGATSLEILRQVQDAEPESPSRLRAGLPRDLVTICLRCLEKQPERRYPSAGALAEDLHRFLEGRPIAARPVSELERVWKWAHRRPALAGLLAALVLALTGGIVSTSYYAWKAGLRAGEAETRRIEAENAQKTADEFRGRAETRALQALTERAIAQARQGDPEQALHWMVSALRDAPAEAQDLRRVLRTNLAAWSERPWVLRASLVVPHVIDWRVQFCQACAFSPDGAWFLLALPKGLERFETSTGRSLGASLPHPSARTISVSFDGRQMLSCDPGVRCWDVKTGAAVPVPGWTDVVWAVFHPTRPLILTTHADGSAQFWDSKDMTPLSPAVAAGTHTSRNLAPCFSPDGALLATVHQKTLQLWKMHETGADRLTPAAAPRTLGHDPEWIYPAPDGTGVYFLTRASHGIERAPLSDRKNLELLGPEAVTCRRAAVAPDGSCLAAGFPDGVMELVDPATGQRFDQLSRHTTTTDAIAFSPTGRHLVVAGRDGTVRIWEANPLAWPTALADRAPLPTRQAPAHARAAYSPDGRWVLTRIAGNCAQVRDVTTGEPRGRPLYAPLEIVPAAFSPDGAQIAAGWMQGSDRATFGGVQLWDAATGQLQRTLPCRAGILGIAFSPDGQELAVGGYGPSVQFWDPHTGKMKGQTPLLGAIANLLRYSPDGQLLSVELWNNLGQPAGVRLVETVTRQLRGPLLTSPYVADASGNALFHGDVRGFSPDSRRLYTELSGDFPNLPGVQTWDVTSAQPLGPPLPGGSAELSTDGRTLVVLDKTRSTLRIYDADSGARREGGLLSQTGAIGSYAVSADGRQVVTATADRVQLWDAVTGQPVGPALGCGGPALDVRFAPDGRTFRTTTVDGYTQTWPVPAATMEDPSQLTLRLEGQTGRRCDAAQAVVFLEANDWQARWQEAQRAGLTPPPLVDLAVWHEQQARTAETAGRDFTALWHLDRLVSLKPDDAWVRGQRARLLVAAGRFPEAEAEYSRVAELTTPEQAINWQHHAAIMCDLSDRWAAARWFYDRLLAADSSDGQLCLGRAKVLDNLGEPALRDADLLRAAAHLKEPAQLLDQARASAEQQRWQAAEAFYVALRDLGGHDRELWRLAFVQLRLGHVADHRRECQRLLLALRNSPRVDLGMIVNVAMACALGNDTRADWASLQVMLRRVLDDVKNSPLNQTGKDMIRHRLLTALGAVCYREGNHAAARQALEEAIALPAPLIDDWLLLALIRRHLGPANEAQTVWKRALELTEHLPRDLPWERRLSVSLLLTEATKEFGKP
jgi:WD40 repeat protein/tetratricopeptide (TPR) repeat protein/tRNA A-37 threonylcarbamoyl transferase component Bud32